MNLKILVVTHKNYWMPAEKIYLPISVGNNNLDKDFLRDSEGDNISYKNRNYCELTAMYWAWKNLKLNKFDYIGLCHYRRYFTRKVNKSIFEEKNIKLRRKSIMTEIEYSNILKNYDIILPKKTFLNKKFKSLTVKEQYDMSHNKRDIELARAVIKKLYPQDVALFDEIMTKRNIYMYNMFVMSKIYFDEYCEWLFNVLFNLEKYIDISNYDEYQSRVYGFLGERLFNVWLLKKNFKIYEAEVDFLENKFSIFKYIKSLIKKYYFNLK
ncbi:DUF4422 domain-containing protein [Megamonas funiformis]|jgi:hypothetical protein|nr:DUF4422 domain-containing protein [Megamonas funiformis]